MFWAGKEHGILVNDIFLKYHDFFLKRKMLICRRTRPEDTLKGKSFSFIIIIVIITAIQSKINILHINGISLEEKLIIQNLSTNVKNKPPKKSDFCGKLCGSCTYFHWHL